MTALSNGYSAVEIVFFQAYELQQLIDGNNVAVEERHLQVLIETKDANGKLVTLSAEQLSDLEWVDVESGKVFSRCKKVDIDPGNKRTIDISLQQNLVSFVVERNDKPITLRARLELNGRVHETEGVTLGAPSAVMKADEHPLDKVKWLSGSTTVSSDTVFTISLKEGVNVYSWVRWPGYGYANSPVKVFNLSLSSKKKILSVTTIPGGDSLFHVGERIHQSGIWAHCWWFHNFATAREFDYGRLKGHVGGESITFSYIGGFKPAWEGSPTGPEKFFFVTVDESDDRHETVLSVTNATYVFRKATGSESVYYSNFIEKKGSA